MQREQIEILQKLTGRRFAFVPADKSSFYAASYQYQANGDDDINEIERALSAANIANAVMSTGDNRSTIVVLDSEMSRSRFFAATNAADEYRGVLDPIGRINGHDVYLELINAVNSLDSPLVEWHNRAVAVVNINGCRLPFYVSSGLSGKEAEYGIASGQWYPLQGVSPNWLNKLPDFYGANYPELAQVCELLNKKYPAARMKQMALARELPAADINGLMKVANYNLPEGVIDNAKMNYVYGKNSQVYVPNIIHRWRSPDIDWLDAPGTGLMSRDARALAELQTNIFNQMIIDDDTVWIQPQRDSYDTADSIKAELRIMGINVYQTVSRGNDKELGVPRHALANEYREMKKRPAERFAQAEARVARAARDIDKKPSKNMFANILRRIKDAVNE